MHNVNVRYFVGPAFCKSFLDKHLKAQVEVLICHAKHKADDL